MRAWRWTVLATAAGVTGCAQVPHDEFYDMEVTSVEVPATVEADTALDVVVEVTVGGCSSFRRFEATRSASRLNLRVVGTRALNVACPAYIGWEKHTYTNPGTPARTSPFEVVVNGTSWGTAEVH